MAAEAKRTLRALAIAARGALSLREREQASRAAAQRLASLEVFAAARQLGLYASLGAEVDTAELARLALAAGKELAFPRVVGERRLAFARCPAEELVPGPLGTRQPPPEAPPVAPEALDLLVVPGVAFDLECRRLGRGSGYYDAALMALPGRVRRVGLAFEVQIVAAVPCQDHDARVDLVVTERRVIGAVAPAPPPAA